MKPNLIATAVMAISTPALANQWVSGNLQRVQEIGAFNSAYGVIAELTNMSWGSGSTPNGSSVYSGSFVLVVGQEGVTADIKDRIFAELLLAYSLGQKPILYVDTSNGANCAIQSSTLGGALP